MPYPTRTLIMSHCKECPTAKASKDISSSAVCHDVVRPTVAKVASVI